MHPEVLFDREQHDQAEHAGEVWDEDERQRTIDRIEAADVSLGTHNEEPRGAEEQVETAEKRQTEMHEPTMASPKPGYLQGKGENSRRNENDPEVLHVSNPPECR